MYDLSILNGKVYINQEWKSKHIYVQDGIIKEISASILPAKEVVDVNGFEVLPGIIDPHVHFELDLGFIKSVDDFYYGSVAAAYGGVTSIVDFLDPVDHVDDLEKAFKHRLSLAKKSIIDYSFHATIKNPKCDLESFVLKMKSLGMHTLKLFTTYSDSNRKTDDDAIIELLKLSKKHHFLLLAHIENDELIRLDEKFTYKDLPISRPSESEKTEALKIAQFTKETQGNMYMVHLSSGDTLNALIHSFSDILGKHFFIESCPQYFSFTRDVLNKDNGYLYTFAPPLRSKKERDLLFEHMDYINTIGTDHCAFMHKDKNQNKLSSIPLGIGGIEHSLNIMRFHLGDAAIAKMTTHIADIQGLKSKGKIEVGYDADFVIYEPRPSSRIHGNHGLCDYSVYEGEPSYGHVVSTIVRGQFVLKDRVLIGGKGKWIEGGFDDD